MSHKSSHMSIPDGTWIGWFVSLQVNEFLCRVPYEYVQDRFNLTGLEMMVPNFYETLDAILDTEFDADYGFNPLEVDPESTAQLYGLIHARYILSARGIEDMCLKYERGDFGICPRIYCNGQLVLPVGLTDHFGESHVKVYCPRCRDVYQPHARCAMLDGAMFGRSFPHMFFMHMPHLQPDPPTDKYTPRIFGFKLHPSALLPPIDESAENLANSASSSAVKPKASPIRSSDAAPSNRTPTRRYNFTIK